MKMAKSGVLKMSKLLISWLIPIGIIILAVLVWVIPKKEKAEAKPHQDIFVQNRKDTIAEFGNSRFVILRAFDKDEKKLTGLYTTK